MLFDKAEKTTELPSVPVILSILSFKKPNSSLLLLSIEVKLPMTLVLPGAIYIFVGLGISGVFFINEKSFI